MVASLRNNFDETSEINSFAEWVIEIILEEVLDRNTHEREIMLNIKLPTNTLQFHIIYLKLF